MGTDKSLLEYHGKPQREFLFDLLTPIVDTVYTSCRKEQHVPPELNPLCDAFGVDGPLNGILSAFAFRPDDSWLIIAVDMPYVDAHTLSLLLSARDETKMATCFFNPDTQLPEPLLTLWEKTAWHSLKAFADAGNVSPREFLRTHPVNMIDPPDRRTLENFNYPKELG
jgi:molybdopterin-guanine dinucleotide biosynthesis protein A